MRIFSSDKLAEAARCGAFDGEELLNTDIDGGGVTLGLFNPVDNGEGGLAGIEVK